VVIELVEMLRLKHLQRANHIKWALLSCHSEGIYSGNTYPTYCESTTWKRFFQNDKKKNEIAKRAAHFSGCAALFLGFYLNFVGIEINFVGIKVNISR
jgi:hypothetical protein